MKRHEAIRVRLHVPERPLLRRSRLLAAFIAAIASFVMAALFTAPGARAHSLNGGTSIASAPPLPLGHLVTSGWSESNYVDNTSWYGEFWRLNLGIGDKFIMDWSQLSKTSGCGPGIYLYIYDPSVTDYTISQSQPVEYLSSNGSTKYEFKWVAPTAGKWTLLFNSACAPQEGYSVTANVQRFTATSIAPVRRHVRSGARVTVKGAVSGVSSGNVRVSVSGPRNVRPLQKLVPVAHGSFSSKLRLRHKGKYRIRVNYLGDATHRPSRAKAVTIRVT